VQRASQPIAAGVGLNTGVSCPPGARATGGGASINGPNGEILASSIVRRALTTAA
jgi:hypothetical protein